MSSLLSVGVIASLSAFNAHAVVNTANTSHAVINTTNAASGCNVSPTVCIMLSSDGVADNQNHGLFVGSSDPTSGKCASYNGATSVKLDAVNTTPTLISTLTFAASPTSDSLLCKSTTTGSANTWHIFKSSVGTIWAVKLNGSSNIPTTLVLGMGGNIQECDPALAFNTTSGCNLPPPAAPITAPIDLHFSKQPETFTTEINLK